MKIIKIKFIQKINRNVLRIITEKPPYYNYKPGEATNLSINLPGWTKEKRPFTFTSLPNQNELEFTIKTYPEHKCVTNLLLSLKPGNELLLDDPFGTIAYKGEGVFIAGGAGLTPFIPIFKDVTIKGNKLNSILFFANKTKEDIFLENELAEWTDNNVVHVLSEENTDTYEQGFITAELIKKKCSDLHRYFYVCGPPRMVVSIVNILQKLKVSPEKIIREIL
jgi:predicted ferric reductase